MSRWYIKFPGDVYAMGPVGPFKTETECRAWTREWGGYNRLPRGFKCWRTDD